MDYEKNENRLGVLKNRTIDTNYRGPAIRVNEFSDQSINLGFFLQIPQIYLDPQGGYFIRVTLVTAKYPKTNLHYIHPYELENPSSKELTNSDSNSVWSPIKREDCLTGIKRYEGEFRPGLSLHNDCLVFHHYVLSNDEHVI